jgi:hypothetical protein
MTKTPRSSHKATKTSVKRDDRDLWLKDIDAIYGQAMNNENYAIALRAKALIAQVNGWLGRSSSGAKAGQIKPVSHWTPEDVMSVLDQLSHYESSYESPYEGAED